jgi:hypothetical protein
VRPVSDEQLPAAEVLETEGYAAWVRALNPPVEMPGECAAAAGAEISPRIAGLAAA